MQEAPLQQNSEDKFKLDVQSHSLKQPHTWLEYKPWVNSLNTVKPDLAILPPITDLHCRRINSCYLYTKRTSTLQTNS